MASLQDGVEALLKIKYKTLDRFSSLRSFWIGADYDDKNGWKWRDHPQVFSGNTMK